jgi:hypothetical protein
VIPEDLAEKEVTVSVDGTSSHVVFIDHPHGEIPVEQLNLYVCRCAMILNDDILTHRHTRKKYSRARSVELRREKTCLNTVAANEILVLERSGNLQGDEFGTFCQRDFQTKW